MVNAWSRVKITIIEDSGGERSQYLGMRAYATTAKDVATDSEEEDDLDDRLVSDLFRHFSGKKALVFGNQKARIEEYADAVKVKLRAVALQTALCITVHLAE